MKFEFVVVGVIVALAVIVALLFWLGVFAVQTV